MAHVLGFTNIDDRGQEGLELAFDDWLAGKPGMKRVIRDLHGEVVENVELLREAQPGRDLTLSIDRRIQYLAYRELKAALAEHHASSGSMVILDAPTGEVLAMVNAPSFNPNSRNGVDPSMRRNRAVTDVVEPGSTMKAFTISAALESGKWKPHSPIDTSPGTLTLADGRVIRDVHNKGMLDVTGVITHSSNVGAAKIGLTLTRDHMYDVDHRFGFGEVDGLGFSRRIAGTSADREKLGTGRAGDDRVRLRSQRDAAAARECVHGDRQRRPAALADVREGRAESGHRRHRSRDRDEHPTHARNGGRARRHRPIRRRSFRTISSPARPAPRARHRGGGYENRYISLFVGMVPAANPRLVGVVVIHDPQGALYYGGYVSAPVFSKVMSGALRLLDVPPDNVKNWYTGSPQGGPTIDAKVPASEDSSETSNYAEGVPP